MFRIAKVFRVLTADLALDERVRYLRNRYRRVESRGYALRGGARVELRPGTTDGKVFEEVFIQRAYENLLPATPVRTIADLGANIGLSTIALLRAYPRACAVAVEPDTDNYEQMLENLHLAGVADRCLAVRGFVGGEPGLARIEDSGNGAWGKRMGPRGLDGIPVYTLPALAAQAHMEAFDLVKCDIEGSERELFATLNTWDFLVRHLVLELHADLYPVQEFRAALDRSAFDWAVYGRIAETTPLSVIALERGEEQAPRAHSAR